MTWRKSLMILVGFVVAFGIVAAQEDPWWRPTSPQGNSAGVGYGTVTPTVANSGAPPSDGELFVQLAANATANPQFQIYSDFLTAWVPINAIAGAGQMPSTLVTNAVDVANSVWGGTGELIFEGAAENLFENEIRTAEPTVGVATFLLPDQASAADIYPIAFSLLATNSFDTGGSLWFDDNVLVAEGATPDAFETRITFADVGQAMAVTIDDYGVAASSFVPVLNANNVPETANSLWVDQARGIVYEGAGVDAFETVVAAQDSTVAVDTYAFVDQAKAVDTYEILSVPDISWTTGNLYYGIDPISAVAAAADADDVMLVRRFYIPHTVTVTEIDVTTNPLANVSADDNTIAVAIYYDADAGVQIVELVGVTDNSGGAATILHTLDIADTTLNPGWYRIGFCAQDATDHDLEIHVVHADNMLILSAGAATGEMFSTGTACTNGDPAATTGALTADVSAVNFVLRTQ